MGAAIEQGVDRCGDDDDEVCCAAFIGRDYICTRGKAVHQLGEMVVGSGGRYPVSILESEAKDARGAWKIEAQLSPCERVNAEPYTSPVLVYVCGVLTTPGNTPFSPTVRLRESL